MYNLALSEFRGLDLPYFFDAQAIGLMLAVPPQIKLLDDLLGQTTMTALREESESCMKFHPPFEVCFWLALTRNAQIVRGHTLHRSIRRIQDLCRCKAWVYLHANLLCPLRKPFAELVQADDIIAMVVHLRRLGHRYRDRCVEDLGQEAHTILLCWRCAFEFVRIVI